MACCSVCVSHTVDKTAYHGEHGNVLARISAHPYMHVRIYTFFFKSRTQRINNEPGQFSNLQYKYTLI